VHVRKCEDDFTREPQREKRGREGPKKGVYLEDEEVTALGQDAKLLEAGIILLPRHCMAVDRVLAAARGGDRSPKEYLLLLALWSMKQHELHPGPAILFFCAFFTCDVVHEILQLGAAKLLGMDPKNKTDGIHNIRFALMLVQIN